MRDTPRMRRLRTDRQGLDQLRSESSILDFDALGEPCERYLLRFYGRGLWRTEAPHHVAVGEMHEVRVRLGASYPRMMPELTWMTPIFHPNVSASGVICLGGYGTHWVPSLSLHELCGMLWDMIRYRNFDVESPYNREAALWAKTQTHFTFPLDERPIRDRIVQVTVAPRACRARTAAPARMHTASLGSCEVLFIDSDCDIIRDCETIVEAEIVPTVHDEIVHDETVDEEIVFLD